MIAQKGMQDSHVKLNVGLPKQNRIQQDEDTFHKQI